MKQRVVITGIGVCAPVGNSAPDFWRNLLAGRSGIGPISRFDASTFPVSIGGEVKGLDLEPLICEFPEAAQMNDRKVWLGLEAARQAVSDAGLNGATLEDGLLHVGVSLETFALEQVAATLHSDPSAPRPDSGWFTKYRLPHLQTPLDCLTQLLGDRYLLCGGRHTNCSACAAGAQAIGETFQLLRAGEAEIAVAGAADSVLNPLGLGGFSLLRILSTENDRPQEACRPFDATRQGTVLSEGAAFMIMESREHAVARGARIYAEVLGYATTLDAYRVSDPEPTGRGAALCMTRAMADAGLDPDRIESVNAHGTGTPKNDETETRAIKMALGARAAQIPVTSIKSMTGHMIAASGAVEAVASALTLHTGKIPPTINLKHPDPLCGLDYVAEGCRPFTGETVLSNSFGFGGQNATLVFGANRLSGGKP